jgi:hypothetical protein
MPPYFVALVFSGLAVIAAWGIRKACITGEIGGSMYHYNIDANPIGFAMAIVLRVGIVVFAGAEIACACGLIGDPILAIQQALHPAGAAVFAARPRRGLEARSVAARDRNLLFAAVFRGHRLGFAAKGACGRLVDGRTDQCRHDTDGLRHDHAAIGPEVLAMMVMMEGVIEVVNA